MVYIIDTHALIWYLEGNPRLGSKAKAIMEDDAHEFVIPIIALAEAVFIVELRKTKIPSVSDLLSDIDGSPNIMIYPLDRDILNKTLSLTDLEMHDRQIVATALYLQEQDNEVAILTKDEQITNSQLVDTIWK
jgi:PIN domain nuclease of toxin-antitoxin system